METNRCQKKTFEQRVQDSIDTIRPMLQNDGGDCELVGIDGMIVKIRFPGCVPGLARALL